MANKRMLHKKICTSEQVNSLSIQAALLFTWMITHADDDGRLKGSAASIRGNVFPMREYTVDEIDLMLKDIQSCGLICRWSDDNGTYIEFPTWKSHQTLQNDRYHPSPIPPCPEHVSKMEPDRFQKDSNRETEDNVTEQNKEITQVKETYYEEKGSVREKPHSDSVVTSIAESMAKNAWAVLDGDNEELLETRYLKAARLGVPGKEILFTFQAIKRDESISNKSEVFINRMNDYLKRNNLPLLDEDI